LTQINRSPLPPPAATKRLRENGGSPASPRADRVKRQQADFFGHFKPEAQEILSDLLEKYTGDSELKCSPASGPVEAGIKLASSLGSRLKGPSNYSMHSRAMVT
jgi:hypothetical protein